MTDGKALWGIALLFEWRTEVQILSLERLVAMAMPKTEHLDRAVGFLYQVKDAIGALEDRELLGLRVSGVAKIPASSSGAGIT